MPVLAPNKFYSLRADSSRPGWGNSKPPLGIHVLSCLSGTPGLRKSRQDESLQIQEGPQFIQGMISKLILISSAGKKDSRRAIAFSRYMLPLRKRFETEG